MKRARIGLVGAAVLAVATLAWAQAKPDFSGTWTLDPATAGTTGGGGRGMGGGMAKMTVKQTADTLSIESEGRGGNMITRTYKLDGSESEIQMGRMTAKATAKMEGDKLIISMSRTAQDGTPVTTTETWSLSDGTLTIEGTGGRGGPSKRVYKKAM
jgi:hypothetical protein